QVDLPWRYTPAQANADRLRPWLCLIALKDTEITRYDAASRSRQLAAVTTSVLPNLEQSWAWAHVQVSGVQSLDVAAGADLLATKPERLVARLLCPRRLDPRTTYTVFLVPTFERGRLGALGLDPGDVDGLAPAWSQSADEVQLPIFFQWRFQTGEGGDFESLARQIQARRLSSTTGIRPMDVSTPGMGLPSASAAPLGLEGALEAPTTRSTDWDPTDRTRWVDALKALLNRPSELMAQP